MVVLVLPLHFLPKSSYHIFFSRVILKDDFEMMLMCFGIISVVFVLCWCGVGVRESENESTGRFSLDVSKA